jgi:hypothetical protein
MYTQLEERPPQQREALAAEREHQMARLVDGEVQAVEPAVGLG